PVRAPEFARHGAAKHRASSVRRAGRSLTSLRACDPLYGGPYSRRRWCFWIRGTGGAMRTQHLLAVSAIRIAGTGTWVGVAAKIAAASANGVQRVQAGPNDISGTVTGAHGPEAGVWVIAETNELPTKFVRIVVTDD